MNPLRWRKMTWLVNVVNVLFLVWIIGAIQSRPSTDCPPADTTCINASDVGTGIGVTLIFVLWFVLFLILMIIWFATRPQRRICPVCGKDVKKGRTVCSGCGHDFAAAVVSAQRPAEETPSGA